MKTAFFDLADALFDLADPGVDLVEAPVDLVESRLDVPLAGNSRGGGARLVLVGACALQRIVDLGDHPRHARLTYRRSERGYAI